MQKKITAEEYKQAFSQVVGLPIIDVFKAAGTELYFILQDKSGKKLTISIDGVWNYDSDNYLFMTEFKNDDETPLQLYKRIEIFVEQKLKNRIKNISEFRFSKAARTVSIVFNDQSIINILPNRFGLISISDHQKKEIVLAKQTGDCEISFFHETD
ncbi:hypothetical protein SDC9_80679 [bioreactor metagenome]|uniref:Uncharacterized protein n=1 Tax=bioreactor metagenome TaxID=1076179 RepID=A0A644Z1C5_9ZZZZ